MNLEHLLFTLALNLTELELENISSNKLVLYRFLNHSLLRNKF